MGKALVIKGANFSSIAVDTIEITVGQPTISIDLFGNVTIASPNGEDIYYTTDGSTPSNQSTKYTAGFNVQMNTTVKAVCYLGGNYSEVVSVQYNGTLQAPTINITNKGVVTITASNNASIRYTVNGADPTSSSGTEYSAPFNVVNGDVVKAIAFVTSGGNTISSSVTTSDPAVVPEGVTFGKRIDSSNGALIDDPAYYVTPKIPIAFSQYSWSYVGAVYNTDICSEYNAQDGQVGWMNIQYQGQGTATRTRTPNQGTVYVRFCGKIGTQYAGAKIVQGGETLWTYDGSTE